MNHCCKSRADTPYDHEAEVSAHRVIAAACFSIHADYDADAAVLPGQVPLQCDPSPSGGITVEGHDF
jgi:hypothetical protein